MAKTAGSGEVNLGECGTGGASEMGTNHIHFALRTILTPLTMQLLLLWKRTGYLQDLLLSGKQQQQQQQQIYQYGLGSWTDVFTGFTLAREFYSHNKRRACVCFGFHSCLSLRYFDHKVEVDW